MINTTLIQAALRQHGFHKVASEVMRQRGEYVPEKWTDLEGAVHSVALKMANNREQHRAVKVGLLSLLALEAGR